MSDKWKSWHLHHHEDDGRDASGDDGCGCDCDENVLDVSENHDVVPADDVIPVDEHDDDDVEELPGDKQQGPFVPSDVRDDDENDVPRHVREKSPQVSNDDNNEGGHHDEEGARQPDDGKVDSQPDDNHSVRWKEKIQETSGKKNEMLQQSSSFLSTLD